MFTQFLDPHIDLIKHKLHFVAARLPNYGDIITNDIITQDRDASKAVVIQTYNHETLPISVQVYFSHMFRPIYSLEAGLGGPAWVISLYRRLDHG